MSEIVFLTKCLKEDREYWRAKLPQAPEPAHLPLDRARSKVDPVNRRAFELRLPQETVSKLHELTKGQPFLNLTTLSAALCVCLHRYTGVSPILFGTSGRRATDETGKASNALAIVSEASGEWTFRQLLIELKETLTQAFQHEQYPFSHLIRDLGFEKLQSGNPLFAVSLTLEGFQGEPAETGADLAIQFSHDNNGVRGRFEYNARIFRPATIERFAGHLSCALADALNHWNKPIRDLNLMTEEEQLRLVRELNPPGQSTSSPKTVVELFQAQVARLGQAVAVEFGNETLSYEQLNRRANQLARLLRRAGVGPEKRVGLLFERSVEMMVGMLAVLKAGGVYVPLDPSLPLERRRIIQTDAGIMALLSARETLEKSSIQAPLVIAVDETETAAEDGSDLPAAAGPDNLAYILYTSGSTGTPKGVGMPHRALANLIAWQLKSWRGQQSLRTLQFASLNFDVSFQEIFSTWCSGGRLCLVSEAVRRDPIALRRYLVDREIERLFLPFIALQKLAEVGPELTPIPRTLREIITAGEQLQVTRQLIEWFRELRDCRLFNHYGPTEGHVVTSNQLGGAPTRWPALPSIGRPIENAQIYLLDPQGRPAPLGAPGELYIGGVPLARGYINQPALTAQKFVADPFSPSPGGRMYRTGDVARYLPDGNIQFLGRNDDQIKVRGYRIEPGEIEVTLSQLAGVREAAVVARETMGDKRLIAYLAPKESASLVAEDLRKELLTRLPEYMVPSSFVILDALPLTATGKVDRRSLPDPGSFNHRSQIAYLAPRNDMEAKLCKIWAEALGVEQVGIADNFFELGGDSILTIQLVARAHQAGLRLQPRQIFQHQTVAALCGAVIPTTDSVRGEQGEITGEAPLTPIQHWFFEQNLPQDRQFNMGYLFEVQERFTFREWREIFRALFRRHDALRLRFWQEGDGWKQANQAFDEALEPFRWIDFSAIPRSLHGDGVTRAATRLQAAMDLAAGRLAQAVGFTFGGSAPDRLLMLVHHLLIDGVSWRILFEDVNAAGHQLKRGEPIRLPAKTTSFKLWAEMLADYAQSEKAREAIAPFLKPAGEQEAFLQSNARAGNGVEASAAVQSVSLSESETTALLRDAPRASNSRIDELLLTALTRAYGKLTGGTTLVVDIEGHGREEILPQADISRTVGWFTSICRMALRSRPEFSPEESLEAVKSTLRGAPYRGIGYGLGFYLSKDRATREQLRSQPRAEVCFNYLGQADQSFTKDSFLRLAQHPIGSITGADNPLPHRLYVNGIIFEGKLRLRFKYSREIYEASTIEALTDGMAQELRGLIAKYRALAAQQVSFPMTTMDRSELETAISQIRLEGDRASGEAKAPTVESIEDFYPLSPAQQGILFHSLYAPESGVYLTQISCLFTDLNLEAMTRAWKSVIERHPALRTALVWETTREPMQATLRGVEPPLIEHDWRELTPEGRRQAWEALLQADRSRGFDLSSAPLMRIAICRMDDAVHRFLWSHHHVMLDGWSIYMVLKDVFDFYHAFDHDRELTLPPAPPYREFVEWLRRQNLAEAETFWKKALAGFKPLPRLGDSNQRETLPKGPLEQRTVLAPALLDSLQSLARQSQITLNTLAQGAWGIVLSRLCDREDVIFGATVSGRPVDLAGVESTVGMFINVLPLRLNVKNDQTLVEYLREIQAGHVEVRQYEYSPLAMVQRWSGGSSNQPLFESILTFQNYPVDDSLRNHSHGLRITQVSHSSQTNYPLTLIIGPGDGLLLRAIFDGRRFSEERISQILRQLASLLEAFCSRPETTIAQLKEQVQLTNEASVPQPPVAKVRKSPSLKFVKPRVVSMQTSDLVEARLPLEGQTLPLILAPTVAGVDVHDWAKGNRARVESLLAKHGAIVFRGFYVGGIDRFEELAAVVCGELFVEYGDLPRDGVGGKVYGSTPYPADKAIFMHNESSHLSQWPLRISFFCVTAAGQGGETPIADCRKIYEELDPALRKRFAQKGLLYVRNYHEGLDVSWQRFFRTTERSKVEAFCQKTGAGYRWKSREHLQTSQSRPAIVRHPETHEPVFFNQLQLHHVSCLDPQLRESLLATFTEEDLPRNVYYGDGTPIEAAALQEVIAATRRSTISLSWKEGDVLLLDNMLVSHGRNPYIGSRKIVVAMGTMMSDESLRAGQRA